MHGNAFLACRMFTFPERRFTAYTSSKVTDLERMVERANLIFYFISISGLIMLEFDFILLLLFKLGKEKKLASI